MSSDEDFVFYGTPVEREEEISSRKKKAVAESSGHLRTALAPWKQEVTDDEGKRRFHGAFTGGYSAGYYNTVGSKQGWTPKSFTSSRKNRAEVKAQSILNFLDDDEKSELEGRSIGTSMQFDTFGFTAAELARKHADNEQQQRPSAIPGPIPDELIVPATKSIGVKLLLKMGWRQGRSIKDASRNFQCDVRRKARKAFLAFSSDQADHSHMDVEDVGISQDLPTANDGQFCISTPAYVLNPKQDLYGLGFDPFKQAPEFGEKKRQRISGQRDIVSNISISLKRKTGPGFGIGALEDLDVEDEDVYALGYDIQDNYVQEEIDEPSETRTDTLRILDRKKDVLNGFKVASTSDGQFERFAPPEIPKDFVPHHKFPEPLVVNHSSSSDVPPPEVPPPVDNKLKVLIEGVATLVARCGKLYEDLSKEKNQDNPLFGFLSGGDGCGYYARKLWEERQKRPEQLKLEDRKTRQNSEKLTADKRGKILGENALERSSKNSSSVDATVAIVDVQFNLSNTFTKPASVDGRSCMSNPFAEDPAKQKRYEEFLKEKYEGGLRTKNSGGSSFMSEAGRARERLEFEAAEATQKGPSGGSEINIADQLLAQLSGASGLQFTSAGVEKNNVEQEKELAITGMYPKREEFQWRPAPILCKRFDLIDPYMSKPPPAPRAKSKMDSLIFIPDATKTSILEKQLNPQIENEKPGDEIIEKEVENQVETRNVERPVDLYKAIFSDDSEGEAEKSTHQLVEDPQKKIEVANTTLNRLIAGDFLESLGKELGLMVPPDLHQTEMKAVKAVNVTIGHEDSPFAQKNGSSSEQEVRDANANFDGIEKTNGLNGRKGRSVNVQEEKRSRKHSSDASSDSDDYRERKKSRSKRKEKGYSREESSKRKHHAKHHKDGRKDSSKRSNSHRSSGKEYDDRKRNK